MQILKNIQNNKIYLDFNRIKLTAGRNNPGLAHSWSILKSFNISKKLIL